MKYKKLWAEENYNCYEAEGILLNYGIKSKKNWGQGIKNGVVFVKNLHAEFFLSENELIEEGENWYNFLVKEENLDAFLKKVEECKQEMNNIIKQLLKTDLSKLSNQELFELYDLYGMNLGKLFNCYIVTQPHRTIKFEKVLQNFLIDKGILDLTNYLSVLTAPSKRFIFSEKGNIFFNGSFSELFEKEIDRTLMDKEMYNEENLENSEKKQLILRLNPSEEIKQAIKILSELGHERFKMRFSWMPALYYNELFLIELKRRFNIDNKELKLYDENEIARLIKNGEKLSEEKTKIRKDGFAKILENDSLKTLEGNDVENFIKENIEKVEEKKQLTGLVASKGYAKGRVIVLSYAKSGEHSLKINKMKEGDIIVTEMTRPNIVLACKKAGAIITDEGGMLCHAGIISREFGIPCIVGTRNATTFLKDGDFVEVDAINGTIKKI